MQGVVFMVVSVRHHCTVRIEVLTTVAELPAESLPVMDTVAAPIGSLALSLKL